MVGCAVPLMKISTFLLKSVCLVNVKNEKAIAIIQANNANPDLITGSAARNTKCMKEKIVTNMKKGDSCRKEAFG